MPLKLLLADDSVTVQRLIERTFAGEGINVILAASSAQAIARAESERPDIVLADVGTPEPDGCAVSAFIKGHPDLNTVPVVLLTSALEAFDEGQMPRAGYDGVLAKPFEPHAVIATVRALLSKRDEAASAGADAATERAATREPSGGDPLEAYFDRLDAAFASLEAASNGPRAAGDGAFFTSGELEGTEPPHAGTDPLAGWAADPGEGFETRRGPSRSNAFVALFAPEPMDEGAKPASSSAAGGPAPLSDEVIDQIARRVIARLDDDRMRQLVIETAERIVREEIDRIKAMTRTGPTHSAG